MPTDTENLTRAVASGDTGAFALFYEQWFDYMFSIARRYAGDDESLSLDVVHDACCRLIRGMKPLPDEQALRAYLAVVVRSAARDLMRREKRRLLRELRHTRKETTPRENHRRDLQQKLHWLNRELDSLSEQSLHLLLMRYRFGWTLKRIGETLGISAGAADGRLARVTAELRRKALEKFDDENLT